MSITNSCNHNTDNQQRASYADNAITEYFYHKHGQDWQEAPCEEDVIDLIADLFHFSQQSDFDVERILRLARLHFDHEDAEV